MTPFASAAQEHAGRLHAGPLVPERHPEDAHGTWTGVAV